MKEKYTYEIIFQQTYFYEEKNTSEKYFPADIFLRRSGDSGGAVHSRLPSHPQGRNFSLTKTGFVILPHFVEHKLAVVEKVLI